MAAPDRGGFVRPLALAALTLVGVQRGMAEPVPTSRPRFAPPTDVEPLVRSGVERRAPRAGWFGDTDADEADPTAGRRGPEPASPGLAALDPKLGPNLRLGADPGSLPANRRAQAEPHLVRSFTDTNLLVATFQEGRFTDGGAVTCGYAISRDGGRNWRRDLIPHLASTVGDGEFDRASDPVAGVDLEGRIYLNTLALRSVDGQWRGTVVISRSDDGGDTFTAPLVAASSSNPDFLFDKNWMAIDTSPVSPMAGRIAVTFTRFDYAATPTTVNPIAVTVSDDQGGTWTAPRIVSPPNCQGSQPMFLPDGSLAVVYWNFDGAAGNQIEMVHSPDGGRTFGSPRPVATVTMYDDPVARDGAFLPSATTDRHLGVLYVACQGWQAGPRILFTRSRDDGATWTPPKVINDTPSNRSVFNAAIAASPDGQHLTVVFYDKRHDNGTGRWVDLYLAESFDGGNTWQPNLRLSEVSSDLNLAPLTAAGRMVGDYQAVVPALNFAAPAWAVWVDARTASPDPYVISINRTEGSTFENWRRLAFKATDLFTLSITGPGADPDGDRLPNQLEYMLGLSPLVADPDPVVPRLDRPAGGLGLSLETLVTATDRELVWRSSTDLGQWVPVVPAATQEQTAARPEGLRREFLFQTGGPARFFSPGAQ